MCQADVRSPAARCARPCRLRSRSGRPSLGLFPELCATCCKGAFPRCRFAAQKGESMSSLRPIMLAVGLLVLPALSFAQEQGEGVTPDGRKGQIYKVQKGDTLWAISQKYLGTPWIWPSVWKENEAKVVNPHLIYPGELIWISAGSMRQLTPEEAARLAAAGQALRPGAGPRAPAAPRTAAS